MSSMPTGLQIIQKQLADYLNNNPGSFAIAVIGEKTSSTSYAKTQILQGESNLICNGFDSAIEASPEFEEVVMAVMSSRAEKKLMGNIKDDIDDILSSLDD